MKKMLQNENLSYTIIYSNILVLTKIVDAYIHHSAQWWVRRCFISLRYDSNKKNTL